ncbi:MAG: hypothetical protein ACD_76C00137G0003 [uncultured bacterium]|nr:MAG: hypothetical protein ACD_76C00137G0003 [uncultured bacterium]
MIKKIITSSVLCSLILLLNASLVSAVGLTPAKKVIYIKPGETVTEKITVINDLEKELFLSFSSKDIIDVRESGGPIFADEGYVGPEASSFSRWVKLPESTKIGAKTTIEIFVEISVPTNADPGTHSGGVFVMSSDENSDDQNDNGTAIKLQANVGSLFIVRVAGDVIDKLEIESFDVEKNLISRLPVNFLTKLKNTGTVHQMPSGKILIKGWWPRNTSVQFNQNDSITLPGVSRNYSDYWGTAQKQDEEALGYFAQALYEFKNFTFGRFKAQLNLEFGDETKQTLTADTSFWVIPWRAVSLFIALAVIVVLMLKLYNWSVIHSHEKRRK